MGHGFAVIWKCSSMMHHEMCRVAEGIMLAWFTLQIIRELGLIVCLISATAQLLNKSQPQSKTRKVFNKVVSVYGCLQQGAVRIVHLFQNLLGLGAYFIQPGLSYYAFPNKENHC